MLRTLPVFGPFLVTLSPAVFLHSHCPKLPSPHAKCEQSLARQPKKRRARLGPSLRTRLSVVAFGCCAHAPAGGGAEGALAASRLRFF